MKITHTHTHVRKNPPAGLQETGMTQGVVLAAPGRNWRSAAAPGSQTCKYKIQLIKKKNKQNLY